MVPEVGATVSDSIVGGGLGRSSGGDYPESASARDFVSVIDRARYGTCSWPGVSTASQGEETTVAAEKISGEIRSEFGKGAARRMRRAGLVPAVIYGHGGDATHVSLPGHDTMMAIKHGGANALLEIDINGATQLALTKQVQVDPIRRSLEHVDFVSVKRGEKVTVDIPVTVVGEAVPDSLVVTENATVQVEAEATHIPETIEVDVEGADIGTQITAADLVLPAGTTLVTDADTLIVNVTNAPSAEDIEAELGEAEAAVGIERDVPGSDEAEDATDE